MKHFDNLLSVMNNSETIQYLKNVNSDKDLESELGYYSNFLDNEEVIQQRIKDMKGTMDFYIARSILRKIYDY